MSETDVIYLDYAATTPVDPRVAAVMHECLLEDYGNPSSTHALGRRARARVEEARAAAAARVGSPPECLFFTSGATEANNLALKGVLAGIRGAHLVTSRIEHKSVLDTAHALEALGLAVTYVAPNERGFVEPERVAAAMTPATRLVSIMHVSNETGVVQDVDAIGALCRERGVLMHVDAAQSVGKLPIALASAPIDLCSMTAHKLCGPKGIGALYVRRGLSLAAQMQGGEQERGLRPGTLATHQIVGFGAAYELADPALEAPRLTALRDALWHELSAIEGARLNGDPTRRAAHVLNVAFPGVEGESLRLALRGIAASAGSACTADSPEASYVLTGMGLSDALAGSSLRFSVGRFTTEAEIAHAAEIVRAAVGSLRALAKSAPAWCSG